MDSAPTYVAAIFPKLCVSVLMLVPGCYDYSGLVIYFDIRNCVPSYFVVFLKIAKSAGKAVKEREP